MGKHREEKISKLNYQNIQLKGNISPKNETEHIAGFPPYIRGYQAMGHLKQPITHQPVCFWNTSPKPIPNDAKIEFLFENSTDLLESPFENKSIILRSAAVLEEISGYFDHMRRLYLLFDNDEHLLALHSNKFTSKTLEKAYFLVCFTDDTFECMENVRKLRVFCNDLMQKKGISQPIPIAAYINTIIEQLYASAIQSDLLLYDFDNPLITDPTNQMLLDNSGILKTIDPFWK